MSDKEWYNVKAALSAMIPNYDNINKAITFGMDEKWRTLAAQESENTKIALEIGSGPGTLAVKLRSNKIICLDPITEMHDAFRQRIKENALPEDKFEFLTGPGESIPLPDNYVDIVYCSFSFRDFYDKKKGLSEIYRVLKNNGKLVILDIAKPGKIRNAAIHFYIKKIAPALIKEGRCHMQCLAKTYRAFGSPDYYMRIAGDIGFKKDAIKFLSFGLAFMLTAKKSI